MEYATDILIGDFGYALGQQLITGCHLRLYILHVTALIALATLGHWRHIRGVRLQDDTVKGYLWQHRGQVRLLEGEHSSYAQYKLGELKQFGGFLLIARKTMEDSSGQVRLITTQNTHHLLLTLATVYHQRQLGTDTPLHLSLKGCQLLLLIFSAPIEVQPYLSDGDEGVRVLLQLLLHLLQYRLPVGFHFLGMQTYHGITVAGIVTAQLQHPLYAGQIDGWQEYLTHACCLGSGDDFCTVGIKFGAVYM